MSVTATGVAPLSYQWQFNGANISGATSSTLVINNLTEANAGSYAVVVANQWGNVTSTIATLTIARETPVITWSNPASISYGTALGPSQLNATANVPGNFAYTPTNGTVLAAGTQTLSVLFTPSDTADYTTASASVSLLVSPAPLTITANNRVKMFGQTVTFAGTEFSASGLLNSDTVLSVTLTSAGAAASATVAGSPYPIVPSVAVGTGLGNYSINYVSGLLTITAGEPVVLWSNPNDIIYGTPLSASQLNASANVAGSFAYTPTNGTVLNSGTNTLTAVFTPNDLADYQAATNMVELVVNPAPLSVTAVSTNRLYGQANPAFMSVLVGVTNGDSITVGATCGATAANAVGNYNIVPSTAAGSDLTNYAITYADGTLTVEPAALTITANNQTKVFGQTLNFAGTEFATSGLVNSDTVLSVTLTSAGAAASAAVAGSPYPIVPSVAVGTGLGNYSINYVSGLLAITAGEPVVLWSNPNGIIYGTPLGSSQLNASANVAGSFAYTPTNGTVLNSGTNTLTAVFTPNDLADYQAATNMVELVVNPAPLSVTAVSTNRLYGQANPAFMSVLVGVTNGDSITVGATCGATAANAVGNYNIVPSTAAGSDLTNYAITYADGTLTVEPATLTITANNQTKVFGQTLTFAGTEFTASGLFNSDTVLSVTLASAGAAASATVAGSPYPIVPSAAVGIGLGNYSINYVSGTLVVTGGALSQPTILSATRIGNSFTFIWSATPSETYQIQYATNLSQNAWANLGAPIAATGLTANGSNTITSWPTFYRLMVVP